MPKVRRTIRVDDADWKTWELAAKKVGLPLSEWIRRQCNLDFFKQALANTREHFGIGEPNEDPVHTRRANRVLDTAKREVSPADNPGEPQLASQTVPECGHAVEFSMGGGKKCTKWGCNNYAFRR
jgi:hypothetical protein